MGREKFRLFFARFLSFSSFKILTNLYKYIIIFFIIGYNAYLCFYYKKRKVILLYVRDLKGVVKP